MRNAWLLFVNDLKQLFSNTVTLIIALGLVAIPSIFSWYNMLACWNVFDNTGNLKVAVASQDTGYTSDLVPIGINVGDRVVSALRENDQLNWVFTSPDDAIDGARSGRYYAALVIPENFSRSIMDFQADDGHQATISYYSNEKKSAIAPKVTDQGADRIAAEVNSEFMAVLSEVAIGALQSLQTYGDASGIETHAARLSNHLGSTSLELSEAADIVDLYAELLGSSQTLLDDSKRLLDQTEQSAGSIAESAENARATVSDLSGTIDESSNSLEQAINQSAAAYANVPASISDAFNSVTAIGSDSATTLRNRANEVGGVISDFQYVISQLESIQGLLPDGMKTLLDTPLAELRHALDLQQQLQNALLQAAQDVESGVSDAQARRDEIQAKSNEAQQALESIGNEYNTQLVPLFDSLKTTVSDAVSQLSAIGSELGASDGTAALEFDSARGQLSDARQQLEDTGKELRASADDLSNLSNRISDALVAKDQEALKGILSSDPALLAGAIAAPVELERHAIYPVENFGSAMSPLYTTLALWIGCLLVMVTFKVIPSERSLSRLSNPRPWQMFLGRYGIIFLLTFLQSTTVCLGNLFFLHVQANDPLLYLLCFWVAGFAFSFIIYTLVASFGNLGKAIGVLLLIIQVSGGGGSFPLKLLPPFIEQISPYLPISHVVNAMRAAMFGLYQNDYWQELGILLLFTLPLFLLGLVLHNPLLKVTERFVEKAESTKLM